MTPGKQPAGDLSRWRDQVDQILAEPSATDDHPQLPCEILPWLYLSSQSACSDKVIEKLGITHIMTLNALPPLKSMQLEWSYREMGVEHTYVDAYDVEGYNMLGKHWVKTCRPVLESVKAVTPNAKIIVHCVAGQNRSGVVVGAALLELEMWPLLKVIRHLKERRGHVLTNRSFRQELCELAASLDLLS